MLEKFVTVTDGFFANEVDSLAKSVFESVIDFAVLKLWNKEKIVNVCYRFYSLLNLHTL